MNGLVDGWINGAACLLIRKTIYALLYQSCYPTGAGRKPGLTNALTFGLGFRYCLIAMVDPPWSTP